MWGFFEAQNESFYVIREQKWIFGAKMGSEQFCDSSHFVLARIFGNILHDPL